MAKLRVSARYWQAIQRWMQAHRACITSVNSLEDAYLHGTWAENMTSSYTEWLLRELYPTTDDIRAFWMRHGGMTFRAPFCRYASPNLDDWCVCTIDHDKDMASSKKMLDRFFTKKVQQELRQRITRAATHGTTNGGPDGNE